MSELLAEKYGSFSGTIVSCGYSMATLILTFFYRFISTKSYYMFYVCFVLNSISLAGSFLLPESPKWLVSVEKQ